MLGNMEIGLLSKLNQVAGRYGLMVSDIDVEFKTVEGGFSLELVASVIDGKKDTIIKEMLAEIGFEDDVLKRESCQEIESALDQALQRAPRAGWKWVR